jgi:hypothetical protein
MREIRPSGSVRGYGVIRIPTATLNRSVLVTNTFLKPHCGAAPLPASLIPWLYALQPSPSTCSLDFASMSAMRNC